MKGHAEKGGKLTDSHEKENQRAGADAETAYKQAETSEYKRGYVSQLDSIYGPMIDDKVVVHQMGETVLRYLQVKQYRRYWKTRSGAGAWVYNADFEGHAAACRRAQKANPNIMSSGPYKSMN